MTLRQIEYVLAVVEEQSFTRAAERLNVTQAGLSQQVKALERSLGAQLIDRSARGVRLTAAGRAFVAHADTALRAEQRARQAVRDVTAGRAGTLEIATVLSVAVGVLPPSLARLHRQTSDVAVRLQEFRHRHLLEEAVAAGATDLAVGPKPRLWAGPMVGLGRERFMLVLPPGDPAAHLVTPYHAGAPTAAPRSVGELALRDVAHRDWVFFTRDNGLSDLIEGHLSASGVRPPVALRTSQVEAAVRLAAAGVGVALVPANVIPTDTQALLCEPEPALTRNLAAYATTPFTGLVQRYVGLLRTESPALEPDS